MAGTPDSQAERGPSATSRVQATGSEWRAAPLPAGRSGAAGDPVSLSLPCSHEVGGHSAQARHDVPELWASAVQAHEVSAGLVGSERGRAGGLCRGRGCKPALSFRGTRSVAPQRCSGVNCRGPLSRSPHHGKAGTTGPAPSAAPFPASHPRPLRHGRAQMGHSCPSGSACFKQRTQMWAPKHTPEGGDFDPSPTPRVGRGMF